MAARSTASRWRCRPGLRSQQLPHRDSTVHRKLGPEALSARLQEEAVVARVREQQDHVIRRHRRASSGPRRRCRLLRVTRTRLRLDADPRRAHADECVPRTPVSTTGKGNLGAPARHAGPVPHADVAAARCVPHPGREHRLDRRARGGRDRRPPGRARGRPMRSCAASPSSMRLHVDLERPMTRAAVPWLRSRPRRVVRIFRPMSTRASRAARRARFVPLLVRSHAGACWSMALRGRFTRSFGRRRRLRRRALLPRRAAP